MSAWRRAAASPNVASRKRKRRSLPSWARMPRPRSLSRRRSRRKAPARPGDKVTKQRDSGFPTRDAIVAYIRAHPGDIGTREIAREFGLKNADRAELKRMLRELADEGVIAKDGKKIREPAALPPTV